MTPQDVKNFSQSNLGIAMFVIIALAMILLGFAEFGDAATRRDAIISFVIAGVLSAFAAFNLLRRVS